MSLINEALKKAQRLRREETAGVTEPVVDSGGGTRIAKRGRARSVHTMVLLASGAVVLIVLSVVLTVYLVNRAPEPATKPTPTSIAVAPDKPGAPETPVPDVIAPNLLVPTTPSQTINPPVAQTPPDTPATAPTVPPSSTAAPDPTPPPAPVSPVVLAPAPLVTAPALPAGPSKPDERITVFIESVKVAGIRSSGTESRVLMNERVYRVNDLVDRLLGVKLVGVSANTLTFSDPNGATYVKQF